MSKTVAILIILFSLISCSKEGANSTKIKFSFNNLQKNSDTTENTVLSSGIQPTAFAEFNCYAVMIEYPEIGSLNRCYNTVSTDPILRPNAIKGMKRFKTTAPVFIEPLEMDVITGLQRKFTLIGWRSTLPLFRCPYMHEMDAYDEFLSNAHVLNLQKPTILPIKLDTTAVPIFVTNFADDLTKYPIIDRCEGPLFGDFPEMVFDPKMISGLEMWLDAADDTTVFTDGSCSVLANDSEGLKCWKDKSDAGNDATISAAGPTYNSVATTQINFKNTISFDGTDDYFTTLLVPQLNSTIFVVYHPLSLLDSYLIGSVDSSPNYSGVCTSTNSSNVYPAAIFGSGAVILPVALSVAGVYLATATFTNDDIYLKHNGENSESATIGSASTWSYNIGALNAATVSNFFNGKILEVLVYDHVLTLENETKVTTYLKIKWGIL